MSLLRSKNFYIQFCFLVAYLILFSTVYHAQEAKKILYLTDIHLNHLYDSQESKRTHCTNPNNIFQYILSPNDYGKYGCDSNLNLLDTLLDDVKNEHQQKLELIVIGGDSLMHAGNGLEEALRKIGSNPLEESKKMFQIIKNKIKEKLNNTNILFVPGNNDFYERYDTPNKDSLEVQANTLRKIFMEDFYLNNKSKFNDDFEKTINEGFYYTYDFNEKLKLIVINSIFFSVKNNRVDENDKQNLGIKHLEWIEAQIKKAEKENRKVILLGHIPPFLNFVFNNTEHLIKNTFKRLIKEMLYKNKENILYFFASHCHLPRIAVRFNIEKTNKIIKCKNINLNNSQKLAKSEKIYDSNFLSAERAGDPQDQILQFVKYSELAKNKSNMPEASKDNLEVKFYSSFISFPSLSPVYQNNPGYTVLEYDERKNLLGNVFHKFFNLYQAEKFGKYMLDNINNNMLPDELIKRFIQSNQQFEFKDLSDKTQAPAPGVYRKLLLKNLWNNKYSYRNDFKFEDFTANDFAKFVFSTLYDRNYMKKYYTFMLGYNQKDYEPAERQIYASGLVDVYNNMKKFRNIFYKIEDDDCDMNE